MKSEVDLGGWLQSLRVGRAGSVFATDVADALSVLTDAAVSCEVPFRVVSLTWAAVPALANELGLLVSALAESVPDFAADLYGRALQQASGKWAQSSIEIEAQSIVQRLPEVQGAACRRILTAASRKAVPSLGKMAHGEQALQLALALEPKRLLVFIAVLNEPSTSESLRSLAQGAEWLATNTGSRVALVLPAKLARRHELDHVTYEACLFANVQEASRTDESASSEPTLRKAGKRTPVVPSEPQIHVSPVEGLPHPRSDAEKHLHREISRDAELKALFGYNRRVSTNAGYTHTVDLLWEQGRLVIELDGSNHRGASQFSRDRMRDLELLLTGYQVVRFTEARVLENTPWVLEQIRQVVRHCSKRESA